MKISIIVPVYKVEKYVSECILSIIKQDYDDIECVIVNDCTPDGSMEIVKELLDSYSGSIQFKIINKEKNVGLSAARNTGIIESSGDYIFFMDSDDYLLCPNAISLFACCASRYPNAEIITGHFKGHLESGNYANLETELKETQHDYKSSVLFSHYLGLAWNRLIKKDLILSNKLFFDEGYIFEDTMWCIKTLPYINEHIIIPNCTYYYRPNPNGITKTTNYARDYRSRLHIIYYLFKASKNECDKYLYDFFTTFQLYSSACIMSFTDTLCLSDVTNYRAFRSQFKRQIMFSHPVFVIVSLFLYYPCRNLLSNGKIRNRVYSLLLRCRN